MCLSQPRFALPVHVEKPPDAALPVRAQLSFAPEIYHEPIDDQHDSNTDDRPPCINKP